MAAHIYQHALENNLLVGHDWVTTTPSSETKLSKVVDVSTETETSPQRRQQRLLRSKQQANTQQRAVNENNKKDQQLPIVFAHGMGDSCFNSGMDHITKKTGDMLGVYSVCIPTGKDQAEDTNNGYALNMDASVDVFAAAVLNNTQLQQGFHAIGFSQGNNVIRGYIAKYNTGNAVVHSFLSINGVNAGEGAVPHCDPSSLKRSESETTTTKIRFDICELLMESASRAAYTEFAQEHVFQANYWRDPRPSAFPRYQKYAQLAKWNNEAGFINETLKENWAKTSTFVWVLATQDSMVFPREGEHWQAPDPNDPYHSVLPMKETEWYKQDLFGLRTADEAGKNYFETFEGDHLAFSEEDFTRWINTYLVGGMHEW
eukprot:CAMPEP_0198142724 /NCGR_PEP_ID=MMETSP1443-20131203/5440_1 /TAXON_ID=186043 /ORGANISM="Entomoneis sp., Strain CCMP2396" /LENGTH=372 /DNA_ID=CAMNT_0043805803 /DNA_START=295 /DNA_END=1410 /DNA_ORIENTATION=+